MDPSLAGTMQLLQLGQTFPGERLPKGDREGNLKSGGQLKVAWLLGGKERKKKRGEAIGGSWEREIINKEEGQYTEKKKYTVQAPQILVGPCFSLLILSYWCFKTNGKDGMTQYLGSYCNDRIVVISCNDIWSVSSCPMPVNCLM